MKHTHNKLVDKNIIWLRLLYFQPKYYYINTQINAYLINKINIDQITI